MALKINLSFKEDELELYKYIKSQRSPSNFVKDCVDFYRLNNKITEVKKESETRNETNRISELLDFN